MTCAAGVAAALLAFLWACYRPSQGLPSVVGKGEGRRMAVGVVLVTAGEAGSASGASVRVSPAFTELRPIEKPKAKNTAQSTTRATKMPTKLAGAQSYFSILRVGYFLFGNHFSPASGLVSFAAIPWKASSRSSGSGKTIVVFFSTPISVRVCR